MSEKKTLEKRRLENRITEHSTLLHDKNYTDETEHIIKFKSLQKFLAFDFNDHLTERKGNCNFLVRYLLAWFIFYLLCLYTLLFGVLTGLLIFVLQLIISEDKPHLTGHQSLLNLSPGMLAYLFFNVELFVLTIFKSPFFSQRSESLSKY